MSALRQEVQCFIDSLSESKLEALRPLLTLLADESVVIETDLTDEEKDIIRQGREEYAKGGFVQLETVS